MQIIKQKHRLVLWGLNLVLEIIFESFIFYRLIQASTINDGSVGTAELINLQYKAIAYILPIAFQVATVLRWEQFSTFVNLYMEFYSFVQGRCIGVHRIIKREKTLGGQ